MLIDQIKLIETKQRAIATEEEDKQEKYTAVLAQANAMLNSVKHTIVQLQIAKVNRNLMYLVLVCIIYNIFRIQQYL